MYFLLFLFAYDGTGCGEYCKAPYGMHSILPRSAGQAAYRMGGKYAHKGEASEDPENPVSEARSFFRGCAGDFGYPDRLAEVRILRWSNRNKLLWKDYVNIADRQK